MTNNENAPAAVDLEPVEVLDIDTVDQLAVVRRANGDKIAINLWYLAGYTRECDGFAYWRYCDQGE